MGWKRYKVSAQICGNSCFFSEGFCWKKYLRNFFVVKKQNIALPASLKFFCQWKYLGAKVSGKEVWKKEKNNVGYTRACPESVTKLMDEKKITPKSPTSRPISDCILWWKKIRQTKSNSGCAALFGHMAYMPKYNFQSRFSLQ